MIVANTFPRFAISEGEAQRLAEAICNYTRHTKIKVEPRTRDLWALIMCIGAIEGPRAIATLQDIAAQKAAKKAQAGNGTFAAALDPQAQSNVFTMPTSRPN